MKAELDREHVTREFSFQGRAPLEHFHTLDGHRSRAVRRYLAIGGKTLLY